MDNNLLILVMCYYMLLSLEGTRTISDKRGPYSTHWKHFDDCGKDDATVKFHVRPRRISRAQLRLEGHLKIINRTYDDNVKFKASLQRFTPSGWKENYLVFDFGVKGVCTLAKEYFNPMDYHEIFTKIHNALPERANETFTCPVEPGDYIIDGVTYNSTNVSAINGFPTSFFYGEYRGIWLLYDEDFSHELGCMALYFDLVPKKKNG